MSLVGGKTSQQNKPSGAANVDTSVRQAPIAHWRSSDNQEQLLEAHLEGVSRLSRSFAAKIRTIIPQARAHHAPPPGWSTASHIAKGMT